MNINLSEEKIQMKKILLKLEELSTVLELPLKNIQKENKDSKVISLNLITKKIEKIIFEQNKQNLKKEFQPNSDLQNSEEYTNLEKLLQKYEAEIRDHIRLEQQLKIYTEGLEEKINKKKNRKDINENYLMKENKKLIKEITILKREKINFKKMIEMNKKKNKGRVMLSQNKNKKEKNTLENIGSMKKIKEKPFSKNISNKNINKKMSFYKKSKSKPNHKNQNKKVLCNFKEIFANVNKNRKNDSSFIHKKIGVFKNKILTKK